MPTATRGPALELFWRMHKWILRVSGGRLLTSIGKLPILVLTTRGRKSGELRTNILAYVEQGNAYVVVASNAGADLHPAWWLNLQEMKETQIEIRGQRMKTKWRLAPGKEGEDLYARFVNADPGYAEYRKRTQREIPVVVLEPIVKRKDS